MIFSLLRLISYLPFPVLYFISDLLYFVAYYIMGYRKKVVRDNLEKCFPNHTAAERKIIEKGFYKNLADIIVESVKLISISESELKKRIRVVNWHLFTDEVKRNNPFIGLTTHQCNWEWVLQGGAVQRDFVIDAAYLPLSNPKVEEIMKQVRSRFGAFMIPSTKLTRSVVTRKNVVRAIAMVADQTPLPEYGHRLTFLNRPTDFFVGPGRIAALTQLPVIFLEMQREKRGHYALILHEVAQPPHSKTGEEIIETYARLVETSILKNPSDWLWSHRRWKHIKE